MKTFKRLYSGVKLSGQRETLGISSVFVLLYKKATTSVQPVQIVFFVDLFLVFCGFTLGLFVILMFIYPLVFLQQIFYYILVPNVGLEPMILRLRDHDLPTELTIFSVSCVTCSFQPVMPTFTYSAVTAVSTSVVSHRFYIQVETISTPVVHRQFQYHKLVCSLYLLHFPGDLSSFVSYAASSAFCVLLIK